MVGVESSETYEAKAKPKRVETMKWESPAECKVEVELERLGRPGNVLRKGENQSRGKNTICSRFYAGQPPW